MMKKTRLSDRMRYTFDNFMAKGPIALIGGLAVVSVIAIMIVSTIVYLLNWAPDSHSLAEIGWMGLMRSLDAGTMGGDTGSWPFLFSMFAITLVGVFVISTLIGTLTTGIEGKLDELRKGRSSVIENGHTVILGWTSQVFTILSELAIANENVSKSCVVILGDRDKVEMEDEIRDEVGDTGHMRIVCRRGSPMSMDDLRIVSLETSKSIIVLSPEDEDPDSSVIKTLLAIINNPARRPEPYHIIAEIHNHENMEVARLVGGNEVRLIYTGSLIARIMAQTCRQSGLSIVYTELMDFSGDEIYFRKEPKLVGKTYGEALLAYEDSAVFGLCYQGEKPKLNPPMDTRIQDGDAIIAISEDDDTVILSGLTDLGINAGAIQQSQPAIMRPEHTLILGWNWRAPKIIAELDNYVAQGSKVTVVAEIPEEEARLKEFSRSLKNQKVNFQQGDTTDRETLGNLRFDIVDHVVVLAYSDQLNSERADARTLITLLHLRHIADLAGYCFSIVSEILDVENQRLATVTRADDFVVSNRTVSLLISQISENKPLAAVFEDICDPEGSEIYLKPVTGYIKPGEEVNFYTVVEAARRQGHTAIGYKIQAYAHNADKKYGVINNPNKSDVITFNHDDLIIVLAEE